MAFDHVLAGLVTTVHDQDGVAVPLVRMGKDLTSFMTFLYGGSVSPLEPLCRQR